MRRVLLTCATCLLLLAATGAPSSAPAAGAMTKHCSNVYYAPMYQTIKEISARGAGCTVAHGVVHSYLYATTSSYGGGKSHTGPCYGAHSYGACTVRYRKRDYHCYHFDIYPKRTRGLVRCTRNDILVKFNVGN